MGLRKKSTVFAALFLASGAALLTYILSGLSLLLTLGLIAGAAMLVGLWLWARLGAAEQARLKQRLRAGLIAGVCATIAYDISRYIFVEVMRFNFWPFDVFTVFGQALVGAEYRGPWVSALGFSYHVLNGITFAIAYALLFGHKGLGMGILWALGLEVLMVSFYPGWLGLKALSEFLQVSVLGHLVYGSVLGSVAKRLLVGRGPATPTP